MKCLTRYAIALALLVSFFIFCAVAQTDTKPNKESPGGQVSGSLTLRGKAAAGVVVAVRKNDFSSGTGPLLKAKTNEDGKYQIAGIPPGTYLIAPMASAFILSETNSDGQRGKTLLIAEDESVANVDFAMVRGAVITGKVTDVNGRPVIEDYVSLIPIDQNNQRPRFHSVPTDDRGIYRMFGIPAGQYKVSVGQGDQSFSVGGGGRAAFQKTFFPNVTDPGKANVVEVAEGAEATNIDITVGQTIQSFSASGRVVDGDTGKPVTNMMIDLSRTIRLNANSSSSGGGTAGHSDRQGEFKIENLVPGKYSISISLPPDSEMLAEPVTFDILDQDVTGLVIKTSAGASLTGMVVLEGSHDKMATAKLGQFYLVANVVDEGRKSRSGGTSHIKPDGSFRVVGLQAGSVSFSVSGNSIKGFAISRIERNGVVQANGIQIQNGEHVTGVRVMVAYGTATIRGVVKLENGTLPADGRLFIQLTKPPELFLNEQPPDIDSRGHFMIEGLFAGTYELSVTAYVPGSSQVSPSAKQLVSVTEGAVTEVTMTIDLKQTPARNPAP